MEVEIPARPVFGIDADDNTEIAALIHDFFQEPLQ
jgi:phage gpG-like protein